MHVLEVKDVTTTLMKSNPPILVIDAFGTVATSGWTDGRLEPRFYIDFPADGIQDFDFCATPPSGMTLQVITPITARIEWDNPPDNLKGVRIHAQTNSMEKATSGGADKALTF